MGIYLLEKRVVRQTVERNKENAFSPIFRFFFYHYHVEILQLLDKVSLSGIKGHFQESREFSRKKDD